ncbi:MAG TPA: hypothetical protein VG826_29300 [Pirellulales bacterium]|nr:hypothetical protein [Pirellulales bacterium]
MSFANFFGRLNGDGEGPAIAVVDEPPAGVELACVAPHPEPQRREKYLRLHEYEKHIAAARLSWATTGRWLWKIHREKLYLLTDESFEAYVERRWRMKGRQGWRYVRAATVYASVRSLVGDGFSMNAAVELSRIKDLGLRQAILSEAIEAAGNASPTEKDIREAIARRRPVKQRARSKPRWKTEKLRMPMGSGVVKLKAGADLRAFLEQWLAKLKLTPPSVPDASS